MGVEVAYAVPADVLNLELDGVICFNSKPSTWTWNPEHAVTLRASNPKSRKCRRGPWILVFEEVFSSVTVEKRDQVTLLPSARKLPKKDNSTAILGTSSKTVAEADGLERFAHLNPTACFVKI